jgi:DNA-binding protein H-NS
MPGPLLSRWYFLGVVLVLEKVENLDLCSPSIVDGTADGKSATGARDLASMSVDELWTLRESIDAALTDKISTELNELRKQLDRLSPKDHADKRASAERSKTAARKHPSSRPVLPKYQNPLRPFETWSGRGRRPLWLKEQLIMGKPLEDFSMA